MEMEVKVFSLLLVVDLLSAACYWLLLIEKEQSISGNFLQGLTMEFRLGRTVNFSRTKV